MTLKIAALFLCLNWITKTSGEAYSKVYVQRGSDILPHYSYGTPSVEVSRQIARLSTPPLDSILPFPQGPSFLPPCNLPCVIQPPASAAVGNAKIVTYKSPNVPVVVTTKDEEPSSYQYSYTVYDENTGDQKSQQELSDGVIVRGQYSFIQPDGYVREVQYTADDITGFNAIVKNFLPDDTVKTVIIKQDAPPCVETKSASLKGETKLTETTTVAADNVDDSKVSTEATTMAADSETSAIVTTQEDVKPTEATIETTTQPLNKLQLYTDIVKCIQAALKKNNAGEAASGLTYFLLPNKPCQL